MTGKAKQAFDRQGTGLGDWRANGRTGEGPVWAPSELPLRRCTVWLQRRLLLASLSRCRRSSGRICSSAAPGRLDCSHERAPPGLSLLPSKLVPAAALGPACTMESPASSQPAGIPQSKGRSSRPGPRLDSGAESGPRWRTRTLCDPPQPVPDLGSTPASSGSQSGTSPAPPI